eukprot:gene14926-16469_t
MFSHQLKIGKSVSLTDDSKSSASRFSLLLEKSSKKKNKHASLWSKRNEVIRSPSSPMANNDSLSLPEVFVSNCSPPSSPECSPRTQKRSSKYDLFSPFGRSSSLPIFKSKTHPRYAHDDGVKYCLGRECVKRNKKTIAVKVCHHTECQESNDMTPLDLCDDCDQAIHVGQAICHLRFQLPKNFKRTASIRSTNSDSGNEEEPESKHFDKKNRGYASARRFFNINSNPVSSRKKTSKSKLLEQANKGCFYKSTNYHCFVQLTRGWERMFRRSKQPRRGFGSALDLRPLELQVSLKPSKSNNDMMRRYGEMTSMDNKRGSLPPDFDMRSDYSSSHAPNLRRRHSFSSMEMMASLFRDTFLMGNQRRGIFRLKGRFQLRGVEVYLKPARKCSMLVIEKGHEMLRIQFYKSGSETETETEVVPAVKGRSLKDALAPLFEKRGLSFDTHSVFLDASHTPLPLAFDIYPLGGNDLHVKAIDDIQVDKRIIEIAKQPLTKEKEKEENERRNLSKREQLIKANASHRGKKNLSSYLGESESRLQSPGLNGRRVGTAAGPNLRDVTRSFNDILSYYRINGIDYVKEDDEDEVDFGEDQNEKEFFMEESWTTVIDFSPDLTKKSKDQQEAIWELFTTEANYLRKLRPIMKLFLRCLKSLQKEGHLLEIEVDNLFGNITDIWKANHTLWTQYFKPVVDQARKDKQIILPSSLFMCFSRFGEICHPYIKYCLEEEKCLRYLKENIKENEKFRTYLMWCEDHDICHRLKLTDLLVKPMQRVTKYQLLLRAILKKTSNQDERNTVSEMMTNVERFLNKVNSELRIRQEQKRMQNVVVRLDSYMPVEPVNDEVEKILSDYLTLDLNCNVPFLSAVEHRCVLMEGSFKMIEKQNRTDVYCFLFTDIFLITKPKRNNEKFKVIKQPFRLNKIVIHPLKESGFLFIYRNEYGSLINAFVLQAPIADQNKWINNIDKATRRYMNARSGHGSTYDFFDDDGMMAAPIAHASPHQSPGQERRPSWQYNPKHSNSSSEFQPQIVVHDQLPSKDIRKPRSYSIEPRRVTSPHVEIAQLSESFDSNSKVARSVSEPKSEKKSREHVTSSSSSPASVKEGGRKKSSTRRRSNSNGVSYWSGSRPSSMIVERKAVDDYMAESFLTQEKRYRSGSLGLDSPAEEESETRRNESFRSTSSDTVLIRSQRGKLKSMKTSSSAPEVRRMVSDPSIVNPADDSTLSYCSGTGIHGENISVTSSSTSVSTDKGALSRESSFNKFRRNEISVLDEGTDGSDLVVNSFNFLDIEADLKESLVDDASDLELVTHRALVDQESQTDECDVQNSMHVNRESQTEIITDQSMISQESQTDSMPTPVVECDETKDIEIQCDLITRLMDTECDHSTESHCEVAVTFDSVDSPFTRSDGRRSSDTNMPRKLYNGDVALRSCISEVDLRPSLQSCEEQHCQSLSDDPSREPENVNNNKSQRFASPGMQALHFLSKSLEQSFDQFKSKVTARKTTRDSSSPVSLHKIALLNSSPDVTRKDAGQLQSKSPSKRATWHVDSAQALERLDKEVLGSSKDDLSMPNSNAIDVDKEHEKPKRPDRKKSRAKRKEEKKKRKKREKETAEIEAGVFSGPNLDRRKAQKLFLENSLMHEKP